MIIEIFSRAKNILDGEKATKGDDLGLTDEQFRSLLYQSDRDIDV